MLVSDLAALAQSGLWLAVWVSLPVIGAGAVLSFLIALFQATTQIQDVTIAHLPRFLAVVIALAVFGNWMGAQLTAFAALAFTLG